MIAPATPEPNKPTRNDGVAGAGQGKPPATGEGAVPQQSPYSASLMVKGLRWGIGRHKRRRVVEQLARWVEDDDPDISIPACRAMIQADSLNVKAMQGPASSVVNVGVSVTLSQSVEAALSEPEYLAFLEGRGDASAVRQGGQ